MYLLTQSLQNGSDIRNVFPLCKVGYFKLYAMKVHPDNSFHEAPQKKAVQLPASVLTSVDFCPVPLFHMPLLLGDVCGNRTYLAVCHGPGTRFYLEAHWSGIL